MEHIEFDPIAPVAEFIDKFDARPDWAVLINEEAKEVLEAVANLAKEMSDLLYVTSGYAVANGADAPLPSNTHIDAAFKWVDQLGYSFPPGFLIETYYRTHASNLSKLGDDGKPIKREDGKILKSKNYKPPVFDDMVVSI